MSAFLYTENHALDAWFSEGFADEQKKRANEDGKRLPPGGSCHEVTEGERVKIKFAQTESYAGSFHHFVVPLPPGGRLDKTSART